jgi:hypothetical protein
MQQEGAPHADLLHEAIDGRLGEDPPVECCSPRFVLDH